MTKFERKGNELFWTYETEDGSTICWRGIDLERWWTSTAKKNSFRYKYQAGKTYELNPKKNTVTVHEDRHYKESKLQEELFKYHWNKYPNLRGQFFHVPNEKSYGSGVVAGVPDMVLLINGKTFFFELKVFGNNLQKAQKEWHNKARANNFHVFTIFTIDKGKQLIDLLIKIWS